jgi:murein DD-endopeptidase MepM/ murein hydrolase activator NlpD
MSTSTLPAPIVRTVQAEAYPTAVEISSPAADPVTTPIPRQETTPTGAPAFEICSPLGMHALVELPQIVSDPYKPPPPNKPEERHHGVDFSYWHYEMRDTMLGEPVQSVLAGVVASVIADLYPYGNTVMIETRREDLPDGIVSRLHIAPDESLYLLYAHLNLPPTVRLGDSVDACQPLGEVGMSGNTDIPHLHLETRLGRAGTVFESIRFYDTRATIEEMDNYVLWRTSGVFRHFDPMALLSYPINP